MTKKTSQLLEKRKSERAKVKTYTPSIMSPRAGQLASEITRVTQDFLIEVHNTDVQLYEYIKMARKDPEVRACIELKCLRATLMLGKYRHPNVFIQNWVQENFDNLQGSLFSKAGRLAAAMPLGFSAGEIVFDKSQGFWRLKTINILDQTRVSFEGEKGFLENLVYQERDGQKLAIPYKKVIHVVNGYSANIGEFDYIYGDPESGTAYQYYLAKKAILTEMMIAGKQNASGIWLGKTQSEHSVQVTDSNGKALYNSDGSPRLEPAGLALYKQLLNIENNSVIVTDNDNSVSPLTVDTKEGFWQVVLGILNDGIRKSYSVPKLIFEGGESSFGQNTIGKQHKLIMDSQIESIVIQIRDQLIEKVVKPLLIWNFGITDNFGTFTVDPVHDPEAVNLKLNNIFAAATAGFISPTDLTVRNIVREQLDIPKVTKEEQFIIDQEALLQKYFENNIYATGNPPPLFAQQALEEKAEAEQIKQKEGLQNEFDAKAAEQETLEGEIVEEEPETNVDGEESATTPEQITNRRHRRNPQNQSKNLV